MNKVGNILSWGILLVWIIACLFGFFQTGNFVMLFFGLGSAGIVVVMYLVNRYL